LKVVTDVNQIQFVKIRYQKPDPLKKENWTHIIKSINMQIFLQMYKTHITQTRGKENHYYFVLKNKMNNLSNYFLEKSKYH